MLSYVVHSLLDFICHFVVETQTPDRLHCIARGIKCSWSQDMYSIQLSAILCQWLLEAAVCCNVNYNSQKRVRVNHRYQALKV